MVQFSTGADTPLMRTGGGSALSNPECTLRLATIGNKAHSEKAKDHHCPSGSFRNGGRKNAGLDHIMPALSVAIGGTHREHFQASIRCHRGVQLRLFGWCE